MAHNGSPMGMSPSPPPQPMSKRDKRRNNITERLADMIATFSEDQPQHYRAQLQAIQVDMTLIIRADPYENAPLDDSPQAIEERINSVTNGNVPGKKAAKDDYLAMAGKQYYEYAQQINRAMEQRDAELVMLKNYYDSANAELDKQHAYKIQIAQREHLELASTIRQRLINTVTKKRDKLLREKEQLDIADSNALFMHPGQFSMNVPNSPGGLHSNRKTRHTRHRVGEAEESVERGRKRKAVGDEDGIDSPVPSYRQLAHDMTGAGSPFHDSRSKTLYNQYEAPAFSVERLFTDKELAHASTVAQFATHHVFHQEQQSQENTESVTNGHPATVPSLDGSIEGAAAATVAGGGEHTTAQSGETPPISQPVEMERTVSYHATRGAAKANPLSFLSDAAAAVSGISSAPSLTNPFLPALVPITKTDKGAPTPPSMNVYDVDNDLALMFREEEDTSMRNGADEDDERDPNSIGAVRDRFLEQATRDQTGIQPFRLPLTDVGPASIQGGSVLRPPHFGFADANHVSSLRNGAAGTAPTSTANLNSLAAALGGSLGGMPMSRATSMGGSEMGAQSEVGGVGMRRTRSRLI